MGKIDDPKVEVISLVVHADMVRCAVISLFDPCVEVTYFRVQLRNFGKFCLDVTDEKVSFGLSKFCQTLLF